jgi:hypothetical protein
MAQPVRGVFGVATWYDPHPNMSSGRFRLTSVIIAAGVPATPVEHVTDLNGAWVGHDEFQVAADLACSH